MKEREGGAVEGRTGREERERESRRAKRRRARCGNGIRERERGGVVRGSEKQIGRRGERADEIEIFPRGPLPPLPFFSRPMVFPSPP